MPIEKLHVLQNTPNAGITTGPGRSIRTVALPSARLNLISSVQSFERQTHDFFDLAVGLIPGERSSGRRQRLGKITKQGNPLLRFLWTEEVFMWYAAILS